VIQLQGLGNETFYMLDRRPQPLPRLHRLRQHGQRNHPFVTRFIIDCLEYWVREMHVDGFRFDLASALARGEDGEPMAHPPVLWGIELSPCSAAPRSSPRPGTPPGSTRSASFPGYRWMEWNGATATVMRALRARRRRA
jgi:isoamylase